MSWSSTKRAKLFLAAFFLAASLGAESFSPERLLNFNEDPEAIEKSCRLARERASMALETIINTPENLRTFESAPLALEDALANLREATASQALLSYVAVSSAARDASARCGQEVAAFSDAAYSRADLFEALSAYAAAAPRPEGENRRLLERELLEYKRNGLLLKPAKRARLLEIRKRLAEIATLYLKNLSEAEEETFPASADELAGLPEGYVKRLARRGDAYLVRLSAADYLPFMERAEKDEARERLERVYDNSASDKNLPLLAEALRLRRESARLLGYYNFAEYALETSMAGSAEAAQGFLHRLERELSPRAEEERAALLALKRARAGPQDGGTLRAWEWRYYRRRLALQLGAPDEEPREFPLPTPLDAALSAYGELLGLKFKKTPDAAVWRADVALYEADDTESGERVGFFYVDLAAPALMRRALALPLVSSRLLPEDRRQVPVSALLAGFSEEPRLTHAELAVLTRELARVMQQLLARPRYRRFAADGLAPDFAPAAAQALERLVWSKEGLARFAGAQAPEKILAQVRAEQAAGEALSLLRQVFYAAVDLHYHSAGELDTTAEYERRAALIALVPMTPGTHPEASFPQLMSYPAAYYGTLWPQALAADFFSRFEEEGLFNSGMGRLLRETVLEPAATQDATVSAKKFLGRPWSEKSLTSFAREPWPAR